ncbi:MAG: hypothetical protein Q9191_003358 [Dirinaria sp. TL-2023a]
MAGLFKFLHNQLWVTPSLPQADHTGQTVIVTGANVGLGLEAARHFARFNARKVIVAVRNLEKGEKARQSIEESTKRFGVVEVWQVDLSSYESVKQFAAKAQGLERLDAVVENAGIATRIYRVEEDNEATISTIPLNCHDIRQSLTDDSNQRRQYFSYGFIAAAKIARNGFEIQQKASPNIFKTLNDKETANMTERYPMSKLLEVFYCRELAARHSKSNTPHVIINYLTPGLCHSELTRESALGITLLKFFFARTTEVGSRTLVHAASAGPNSHGQYLRNCEISEPAPVVLGEEGEKAQARVWEELSQKLEKIQPGIVSNV